MSPKFEIVEAKRYHCGQIARRLRPTHLEAFARVRLSPHHQIRFLFDHSDFRRSWLIDGEMGAMFGVVGPSMAPVGHVWLFISNRGANFPIAFIKETRRQLDEIMVMKRILETTVTDGHEDAQRLAAFLGFYVSMPPLPGAAAYSRRGRRRLVDELRHNPDLLVPAWGGVAVQMGYMGDHP